MLIVISIIIILLIVLLGSYIAIESNNTNNNSNEEEFVMTINTSNATNSNFTIYTNDEYNYSVEWSQINGDNS